VPDHARDVAGSRGAGDGQGDDSTLPPVFGLYTGFKLSYMAYIGAPMCAIFPYYLAANRVFNPKP